METAGVGYVLIYQYLFKFDPESDPDKLKIYKIIEVVRKFFFGCF